MKETNQLLSEIEEDIKEKLSVKRFQHSIGVMKRAEELAKKYNADIQKAKLVGLAHDIGKDFSKEEKLRYIEENQITVDDIEKKDVELLHTKIGADICKNKYGFSQDMVKAIEYHTTGNVNMDLLAKILFIADKTEEGRKYLDREKLKNLEEQGIDYEMIYLIDRSVIYTIEKGHMIHPDSIYTRNQLIQKNIIK